MSALIFVRDERTLPYVPVTLAALDAIRASIPRKRLPYARSLYLALLEVANENRAAGAEASRKMLADLGGMSPDIISDLGPMLVAAGVVEIHERYHAGERLANEWLIVEPPDRSEGRGPQPSTVAGGRGPQPQQSLEEQRTEEPPGTRASERVDPREQAPPGFPDDLRPSAGEVLRLLNEVAAQHGLPAVRKLAVGRAVMNHPRKPHVATARALHTWAADPPRPIRNVVGTFSTWLGKERDLAGPEQWRAGDGVLPANVTRMTPRQAEGDFNTRHYMRQAGLLPPGESV